MADRVEFGLMGMVARCVRASASAAACAPGSLAVRNVMRRWAWFMLVLCLLPNAAAADAEDAKLEKEYTGTLTGSIQAHPDNPQFPYWLKCDNSTYGIVIGKDAQSKTVLEEYRGTRISLTGTIREFADGGLAVVPEVPLRRPGVNPALALVKKAISRTQTAKEYIPPRIVEEILLGNGEDVFIVGVRSKTKGYWDYSMISVKDGVLTVKECICPPVRSFGAGKDWITIFTDNDRLHIVFLRNGAGRGITESWIYENGKLYELHAVSADGECKEISSNVFMSTIGGSICELFGAYWLKSGNSIYAIESNTWDSDKQVAWLSERVGKWIVLTGKTFWGDYWPSITPKPAIQEKQPSAAVSISGKSVLYDGKPIFTTSEGTSLSLQEELVLDNGDAVSIVGMATGDKACPHLYKIFSVRGGACTATDAFGNGDGKPIVSPTDDNAVSITFNRFNPGKGLAEAWTYKEGTVSKAQGDASSRLWAASEHASQEKPPKSLGPAFARGKHPIDLAQEACVRPCEGKSPCLNECRAQQQAAWEREMNKAYAVLLGMAENPAQKEAVRMSQEQWLQYKDAEETYFRTILGSVYGRQIVGLYRERATRLMCQAEMNCLGCPHNDNCP